MKGRSLTLKERGSDLYPDTHHYYATHFLVTGAATDLQDLFFAMLAGDNKLSLNK